MIDGIRKLAPGDWMEWRDGRITTQTSGRFPTDRFAKFRCPKQNNELDSLLPDSIREHLLSDVPLGVWLSGGIDSTSILHYAAKACPSRLKTFSISFEGRSFDESSYIRQAVEEYGTEHEQLDLNPSIDLVGAIEEFAYYSDEPSADAGALPVWFLSKLCKTQTTVALSGEGADELFGGYLTYRANRIARYVRKFPRLAVNAGLALLDFWPVSDEKIGFEYKVRRMLEGSLLSPERAHVYWNGTFAQGHLNKVLSQPLPDSLDEILGQLRNLPPVNDDLAPFLWLDQKYFLADDILTKSDRMSMAHSVEVRPAFLDHRIVEFAASLPAKLKIRGSQQKVLLRELMKDKLPSSILKRKKIGFDIPAHEWLRGPLRPLLQDVSGVWRFELQSTVPSRWHRTSESQHFQRKMNVGYHLWGLLILFLWMKKWQVKL